MKGASRAQAIVEFAFIAPLLVVLILGSVDASYLVSNKLLMITAARHGARIAAQLGGTGSSPASNACQGTLASGTTQTSIDQQIVQSVAAVAQNSNFALIDSIDIYKPTAGDGSYTSGDKLDSWSINSARTAWVAGSSQTYLLSLRCQGILGNEAPIAVRVTWHYSGVNSIIKNLNGITEYADELMTLKDPNAP